jgi:D-tagatose-1,6-bisphosphate aldolase subunit GatZ/KbaZ
MKDAFSEAGSVTGSLQEIFARNRAGERTGIFSICSANRHVLQAGMHQAHRDRTLVCIESTSNQVNQFGGYTGMTAADFAVYVRSTAAETGFPAGRIVLGGDHLGPHVWQDEPAAAAMAKACELIRSCVLAGYVKIHLDTSMRCADDPGTRHTPLSDETVMERAARLCQVAEEAHALLPPGSPAPLYVIGTEVPVPGGEQLAGAAPSVTRVDDVERTLRFAQLAFESKGLEAAWRRVIGLVVQPGVEFGDVSIFEYDRAKARPLSRYIESRWHVVYEAHSTDYQASERLKQMVEDHFAILKVGPWLTFAFREAVFALAEIEREWLGERKGTSLSQIRETLEAVMIRNPVHWRKYYAGDEAQLRFARKYSYSDRSRYYWPEPEVQAALGRLLQNLTQDPAPLTLLSQYMPLQYAAVRSGQARNLPGDLIRQKILEVMDGYAAAVGAFNY